ncbi:MAG TPA: RHS repeat-associated core domain-containing protein [Gammaproteobacteria bacterium]
MMTFISSLPVKARAHVNSKAVTRQRHFQCLLLLCLLAFTAFPQKSDAAITPGPKTWEEWGLPACNGAYNSATNMPCHNTWGSYWCATHTRPWEYIHYSRMSGGDYTNCEPGTLNVYETRNAPRRCPPGYELTVGGIENGELWYVCELDDTAPVPEKSIGKPQVCVGNPVSADTGNKYQAEIDIPTAALGAEDFTRHYNSDIRRYYANQLPPPAFTKTWRHTYERYILVVNYFSNVSTAVAHRPDGKAYYFAKSGNDWLGDDDVVEQLVELKDAQGTRTGWHYIRADNALESYDANGQLQHITQPNGITLSFTYDQGRLSTVSNGLGYQLDFSYDVAGKLIAIEDSSGAETEYFYDTSGRLITVEYDDDSTRQYHYENASHPHALTGITDERGIRFAWWYYYWTGQTYLSQHALQADKTQLVYNTDGTVTVTNPLGKQSKYHFTVIEGMNRLTHIEGIPSANCAGASQTYTYTAEGWVDTETDWNGTVTDYNYNSRGLEIQRIEAKNTPQQRTITTEWHSTLRLPTRIIEPRKITELVYDDANGTGNVLTRTEIDNTGNCAIDDTLPGCKRITSYTYNSLGLLETVDGPRTDVNDVTAFTYDSAGNRATVNNALNHVTSLTSYDAHGNPLTLIDPNGVVTTLTYDARQRLLTRTVAASTAEAATTQFDYDGAGNLTRITQADGSFLDYTYDNAQRLIGIEDSLGNRIDYTLDKAGNRLTEKTYDPSDVLTKTQTSVFDELSRLLQTIGASSQSTLFTYDNNGNTTSITDPESNATANTFDPLNRLINVIDPENGVNNPTVYAYDAQDNLTAVTDPEGLSTTYGYNGFGEVISQTSPDTGTTTYTYDTAGNRTGMTDARGVTVTYSYDALDRLTGIDYPGTSEDITYVYDQTANGNIGIGRLTQVTDQSGSLAYTYDRRGNISQADHDILGQTHTISYEYTLADQLSAMVYPSGRRLDYQYNNNHQITAVTATFNGQPQTLATAIGYLPFGPMNAMSYGNGLTRSLGYDLDYRVDVLEDGAFMDRDYSYDLNSNISDILDLIDSNNDQHFDYDPLNRLTDADGAYGIFGYSYDGIGNRLTRTLNSTPENYSYYSNTHRLHTVDSQTRSYDAAGNTVSIDGSAFDYNHQNRLSQATVNGLTTDYTYNALGQRVIKQTPTATTVYLYDINGHLIGEYNNSTSFREYAYLAGQPLALHDTQGDVYYVHNDHLGTPQAMTDQSQTVVWRAQYDPFGLVTVNEDPDNDLVEVVNNIRYPGQYFDSETGLHYNWNRYYDPVTGRYITSDPIGIIRSYNNPQFQVAIAIGALKETGFAGEELNHLYGYVNQNPLYWVDPYGLAEEHTKNQRESNREKHEKGDARKNKDRGNEKGDKNRGWPRKRPPSWKGPWPPRIVPLLICPICSYVLPPEPPSNSCDA